MPVYPIEISEKLNLALQSVSPTTEPSISKDYNTNEGTDTAEALWVKAILTLESGDKLSAKQLLVKMVEQHADSFNAIKLDNKLKPLEKILIASYAELLLIDPIKYQTNKPLIKQLRKLAERLSDERLKSRLCHALAIIMLWRRDSNQALKYLYESRSIYQQLNEELGSAYICDTLGSVFTNLADHQQALLYYTESLAVKTHLQDKQGRAITLGNLARLCLQMGRYEQADQFAKLDLQLCQQEPAEIKARVLNLLARINIAAKQWQTAKNYLAEAIELYHHSDFDGLFFCHKDLLLLKLEQNQVFKPKDLEPLQQYLSHLSPYHQLQFDILQHKSQQKLNKLDIEAAQQTLTQIQLQSIPEIELDYRIWLCQAAFEKNRTDLGKYQLLLARKIAKKLGYKRYAFNINSLMLQYDIHENVSEETQRPISASMEQVDDGYLIRNKLGEGGFGSVYLAHDMIKDCDVALKQFHLGDHWDHNEFQNKWNQARIELESVATIKHPAVAQTYALGHDNFGSPYLVQEYLSGGELKQLMATPKSLDQVLTYLIPIVQGLAAIHQAGVIHRDLKPENILLNAQRMPVIVDFGIALLKHESTKHDRIQGSVNYSAPEQLESTDIDHRADLYSIGCILFEWMSGKPPEFADTNKGLISSWLKAESNIEIDETIFAEATPLLRTLLQKNPEKRPSDANDLLLKLNALRSTKNSL